MRTTIKAWIGSNLGRILPWTEELAALERGKNLCIILSSTFIFDRNFFILAGKEDSYYIWHSGERSLAFGLIV